MRLPPATYSLSKSDKYAKNAMEIVHEPKYVGSNNLEIFFSLYDAIFNSTVHFKIVTLFSLGFVMCHSIGMRGDGIGLDRR